MEKEIVVYVLIFFIAWIIMELSEKNKKKH